MYILKIYQLLTKKKYYIKSFIVISLKILIIINDYTI